MSLNWSIERCRDHEDLLTDEESWYTHQIVLTSIVIGMGEITEKNWEEFFLRMAMWEKVAGPILIENHEGEPRPIYTKPEWVERRIGLTTNVIEETKLAFGKKIAAEVRDHATREFRRWEKAELAS